MTHPGANRKRPKLSKLPHGAKRSHMSGPTRGRRHNDKIEDAPPRLRNAAADPMLKSSRSREEMHPSLKRLSKKLRSRLYTKAYGKDRPTPGEVC